MLGLLYGRYKLLAIPTSRKLLIDRKWAQVQSFLVGIIACDVVFHLHCLCFFDMSASDFLHSEPVRIADLLEERCSDRSGRDMLDELAVGNLVVVAGQKLFARHHVIAYSGNVFAFVVSFHSFAIKFELNGRIALQFLALILAVGPLEVEDDITVGSILEKEVDACAKVANIGECHGLNGFTFVGVFGNGNLTTYRRQM